mmetsp:Transcript_6814/g.11907  ORF Transcript_6814/g.11907 Transcript_6814/m.11907 type:complete len:481 (+) Transcript_6814:7-1449(+)
MISIFIFVLCFVTFINALAIVNRQHSLLIQSLQKVKNGPKKQWFDQYIDHFNHQDNRMWKQRFYVNDTFYNDQLGGPVFFQIGGEGAISPGYVTSLQMSRYAQSMGALQVTLEHRFYGESHPFPDMRVSNLRYLSSQQALTDAARFITHIKKLYPNAGSVITFGGSYPGALASWFRGKFPTITQGAIASSAPVHAVVDMVTYLDVVGRSLDMLGGVACDNAVKQATTKLDSMLKSSSGLREVSSRFQTCTPLHDPLDIQNFLSTVIGNFMGVVQYNREIKSAPTVKDLCKIMENTTQSPFDNLVDLSNQFTSKTPSNCIDVDYNKMIAGLKNITNWGETGVGIRQWTYQTCAEFGFFQTTDGGAAQPFGSGIPLSFYTGICREVFGFDNEPPVEFSNLYYGSSKPLGSSRIVFVNGNVDPWSSLSVLHNLSPTLLAVEVDGGAHCSNMRPWSPGMNINIKHAQTKIAQEIQTFLSLGPGK